MGGNPALKTVLVAGIRFLHPSHFPDKLAIKIPQSGHKRESLSSSHCSGKPKTSLRISSKNENAIEKCQTDKSVSLSLSLSLTLTLSLCPLSLSVALSLSLSLPRNKKT